MELEKLTPQELDAHVANGTFRLALVGMSNAGKSYRSRVLRDEAHFLWYHVDEEIQKALGFTEMDEISKWLGYPTGEGYAQREARYLELENVFTKQAAMQTNGVNLVFDTTGSVVHLDPDTLDVLKQNCLIVHLDVGEDSLATMLERYFKEPKPVAWAGNLMMKSNESEEEALRRSYPNLLRKRLAKYRELAHVNIPASELRDKSAHDMLEIIKSHL